MTEELEKPERTRGANAGIAVVDHDRTIGRDATRRQEVLDHPEERLERRRIGIGQADAEEIEVHRVSQVPLGKQFRGAQIDERRAPALILELAGEFARTDQELRVRVALGILHH